MLKEFKKFALKGNMIDLAVGIIIGGAFGTVVNSLVNDILTPLISGIFRIPDFSDWFVVLKNPTGGHFATIAAAKEAGAVVLSIGTFINAFIAFILMAWALFFIVKGMNKLKDKHEAAPKEEVVPKDIELLTEIRDALRK